VEPDSEEPLERHADPDEPFCALAFKIQSSAHGDLTFARIYSGTLTPGTALYNPRVKKKERVARILKMHAEAGVALETAVAGDIVALQGLKWTGTGDTLCPKEHPILLEALVFPEPVIQRVVEPQSADERDKLRQALERMSREDPSFHVSEQEETGQWLISGMGELHLEVVQHRLESEFKVHPHVGHPRVAYREAVVRAGSGSGVVDRALGGKEVYARVELVLEPAPEGLTAEVELAPELILSRTAREALRESLALEARVGPRFGYPMVRARIRVESTATREGRESDAAYAQAGVQALRHAMQAAEVVLEEPMMRFEIQTPAEFSSGIIADLNARSADLREVSADGSVRSIRGEVPLSAMFGYSTAVRSLSQGRASFAMLPSGYRAVPEHELEARGLTWT
jgi:elongation factor G